MFLQSKVKLAIDILFNVEIIFSNNDTPNCVCSVCEHCTFTIVHMTEMYPSALQFHTFSRSLYEWASAFVFKTNINTPIYGILGSRKVFFLDNENK